MTITDITDGMKEGDKKELLRLLESIKRVPLIHPVYDSRIKDLQAILSSYHLMAQTMHDLEGGIYGIVICDLLNATRIIDMERDIPNRLTILPSDFQEMLLKYHFTEPSNTEE